MRSAEPVIETVNLSELREQLKAIVNRVQRKETRFLLEQAGVPVAALVSTEDLERLDRLSRERAERFRVVDEMWEIFKDVPPDEVDREADRAVAELRAESREDQ